MSGTAEQQSERELKRKVPASAFPPPAPVATFGADGRPEEHEFLSRDLTWLEFNRRVLHEALDDRTPLLERFGFWEL